MSRRKLGNDVMVGSTGKETMAARGENMASRDERHKQPQQVKQKQLRKRRQQQYQQGQFLKQSQQEYKRQKHQQAQECDKDDRQQQVLITDNRKQKLEQGECDQDRKSKNYLDIANDLGLSRVSDFVQNRSITTTFIPAERRPEIFAPTGTRVITVDKISLTLGKLVKLSGFIILSLCVTLAPQISLCTSDQPIKFLTESTKPRRQLFSKDIMKDALIFGHYSTIMTPISPFQKGIREPFPVSREWWEKNGSRAQRRRRRSGDAEVFHPVTVTEGSNIAFRCNVPQIPPQRGAGGGDGGGGGGGGGTMYVEQIITWRKLGTEVPIYIQFNGYPPHVDISYQGRVKLAGSSSTLELTDVMTSDEGAYSCSIVFLGGGSVSDKQSLNGTWTQLTVNTRPRLRAVSPPTVLLGPPDQLDLLCEGYGRPTPVVSWLKDGRELSTTTSGPAQLNVTSQPRDVTTYGVTDERHVIVTLKSNESGTGVEVSPGIDQLGGGREGDGGRVMRVVEGRVRSSPFDRPLVREDGGVYTCVFKNIIGVTSHTIKTIVQGGPHLASPIKNVTVAAGSILRLSCAPLDGTPPVNNSHHWSREGRDVTLIRHLAPRVTLGVMDGTLAVTDVTRDDAGWYTCRPSVGVGAMTSEASAFVDVTYMPVVLSMPTQLYLARSMLGRIDCPVDANPPVTLVTWSKNERVIDVTHTTRIKVNSEGTLIIKSVTSEDEGRYTCTPVSPLGVGMTSSPVQVIVRDPPYFVQRPRPIYQRQLTQQVTLPCDVSGDPKPSISWKKVGGELPPRLRASQTGGNLTIDHITRTDHGRYECIATNIVASVMATTLLIVELGTSHAPYNVTAEMTSTSAKVSWNPAFNDGKPQHYLLWYRVRSSSNEDWSTIRVVGEDTYSVTVYRLEPSTVYQFIVLARTADGDEMFSQTVSFVTLDLNIGLDLEEDGGGVAGGGGWDTSRSSFYQSVGDHVPSDSVPLSAGGGGDEDDEEEEDEELVEDDVTGGRRLIPVPPINITVRQQRSGLIISWLTSRSSRTGSRKHGSVIGSKKEGGVGGDEDHVIADSHIVQYKTVGNWVDLTERIPVENDLSSYEWKTVSRGSTYNFRIIACHRDACSQPSHIVTYVTSDPMSTTGSRIPDGAVFGVVVIVVIIVVVTSFIALGVKVFKRRRRKKQERYVADNMQFHDSTSNSCSSIPRPPKRPAAVLTTDFTYPPEPPRCLQQHEDYIL